MITITDKNGGTIRLNDHLIWKDEGQYSDHAQNVEPTLTGAIIVEDSMMKAGRPITLQAEPNQGLKYRADIAPLKQHNKTHLGESFTLTLHSGEKYKVVWRAHDGVPIETNALIEYANPEDNDYIGMTLRFLVVE